MANNMRIRDGLPEGRYTIRSYSAFHYYGGDPECEAANKGKEFTVKGGETDLVIGPAFNVRARNIHAWDVYGNGSRFIATLSNDDVMVVDRLD